MFTHSGSLRPVWPAQLGARSKYAKEAEAVIRATREKEGSGDMYGAREVSLGEVTTGKAESLSAVPARYKRR